MQFVPSDSKQSPHQRNRVSNHHEVFNEGYSEYYDRPLESPIHKKFSPNYIPANVPVNLINHDAASPGFNNISARSEGYRSPIASCGNESPLQLRRGSPYPVHQHGFRHICDNNHKQTHAD